MRKHLAALLFVILGCPTQAQVGACERPVPERGRGEQSATTSASAPSPSTPDLLREQITKAMHSTVAIVWRFRTADGIEQRVGAGSGVVIAPHTVLTASHVLLGGAPPKGGTSLGRFVAVDASWDAHDGDNTPLLPTAPLPLNQDMDHDLTLLDVPGLEDFIPPSPDDDVSIGDEAFFIGHPIMPETKNAPPAANATVIRSKEEISYAPEFGGTVIEMIHAHGYKFEGSLRRGNSGGALISRKTGRVIGIVSMSNNSNVGFAVAADEINAFLAKPHLQFGVRPSVTASKP